MAAQVKTKHERVSAKSRHALTSDAKKTAQVGAKEAIGTFCQLLHQHGTGKLSPEELRQAKFDRPEAVSMHGLALKICYQNFLLTVSRRT